MRSAHPDVRFRFMSFAKFVRLSFVLAVFAVSLKTATGLASAGSAEPSAEQLLEKYDAVMGPENFDSSAKMTAKREDGSVRTYDMRFVKKGTEKFRIWFKGPAAVAGQEVLRVGDNSWVYLPNLKRATRIANRDSFQGGDFNNADVLRVNYKADYNAVLEKSDKPDTYLVQLKSKNANTSYDIIKLWLRKADAMPVRGEYFGTSGKILRSAEFSEYKEFSKGYRRPAKVVMRNELIKERFTELLTQSMNVSVSAPDQRFTLPDLGK
ncbi:MAG: outer membrane lipoprotein-sorting protein [Proteobacteria bacterium]|nr:outer membrane lipoprotein-sorting protein [Pseudomonadota bacterium]